jgi:enoyl-[acyl-carrier protein] reductase II
LGAEAVQIGSRFIATPESSAHAAFKERIITSVEGDTRLSLKALTPVRLRHNDFAARVQQAEARGVTHEELTEMLGRGRAKKGMFEGDLSEGELEVGQVSSMIRTLKPAAEIVQEIMDDFRHSLNALQKLQ